MAILSLILEFLSNLFSFDQAHPLLFTQFYFWAFFALVFAVFSLVHSKVLLRNAFLFAASLFFYYKTSGLFLLLLLFVIVYNFFAGKWLHKAKKGRTAILILSVAVDLGLLAYFKYAYFITDLLNNLLGTEFRVFDIFAWVGNQIVGGQTFHVDSIFFQGRVFEDVRILFEDGMVRQVSMGEEGREESKYLDRWQSLRLSRIIMGLNMDLLESLYGKEDIPLLPEALTRQSCLSFVLGPESTAAFPYENVRLISALREDDTFSDVMREGLFMPVGADSMNLALMRIYQNK